MGFHASEAELAGTFSRYSLIGMWPNVMFVLTNNYFQVGIRFHVIYWLLLEPKFSPYGSVCCACAQTPGLPVLLAHADVTENIIFFQWVQDLGTHRHHDVPMVMLLSGAVENSPQWPLPATAVYHACNVLSSRLRTKENCGHMCTYTAARTCPNYCGCFLCFSRREL